MYCNYILCLFLGLVRHEYKIHKIHDIQKYPNVCEKCQQPYPFSHKCKEKNSYQCKLCDKVFRVRRQWKDHVKGFHEGDKPHLCHPCGKNFASEIQLKEHNSKSHNRQNCSVCGKSILNTFYLKKHLVFEHNKKDGALFCDICPKKVFFVKGMYKKHMVEKHSTSELE